jgi:hypothetical protein
MAVVYATLGTMIIYYGEKCAGILTIKNKAYGQNNENTHKLIVLSFSIGGIFLIKSLCGLLTAFHVFGDFYPVSIGANVWDFFVKYV